jgi:AcrR family transcriptional regulator
VRANSTTTELKGELMAKKQRKKLSKEAILAEAKQLFSTKGYRATTLQDLTSSFGVSRPSLYYYFKSKMELLSELHCQGYIQAFKHFEDILSTPLPTNEKFRKILEIHISNMVNDTELHRIFHMDIREMPEKLVKEIKRRRKEYENRVIAIYQQGVDEGIFKKMDPKMAVYLLLGACNALTMWYSPKKNTSPEAISEMLMTLLCEGYEK